MLPKTKINNNNTMVDKINSFVPARNLAKPGFGECSPCCTPRGCSSPVCIPARLSHQLFIKHMPQQNQPPTTSPGSRHHKCHQTRRQLQVTPQQHLVSAMSPPNSHSLKVSSQLTAVSPTALACSRCTARLLLSSATTLEKLCLYIY